MNEKLINKAGFSSTFERDRLNALIEIVFNECVTAVKNTPTHCAYTTHDLGTVTCTIDKSIENMYNHFDKTYKAQK